MRLKRKLIIISKSNIMKSLIAFIFFCFIGNIAFAQWSSKSSNSWTNDHLLYAQGEMLVGNSSGGNLGLNFVYNSKYSIQVGFSLTSKQSEPISQESISTDEAGNSINPVISANSMENYYCMIGRYFELNTKKSIRMVVQGGPGLSVIMDVPDIDNFSFAGSDTCNEISLMLNSKVEFPFSDLFCLSIGPTYIVNKQQTFFGAGIGIAYGIVKSSTIN